MPAPNANAASPSLLQSTGLAPFADRPAGKLSGGMKQKLGLCCALIHDPDLLILDEPTTGVDPLSRRQFWDLIGRIRAEPARHERDGGYRLHGGSARFDWLMAMDAGRVLADRHAAESSRATGAARSKQHLLHCCRRKNAGAMRRWRSRRGPPGPTMTLPSKRRTSTMRFGDFVAVDHVSFHIQRGEIFGFLGSNGCGKTTTMKMLTGLLPASEGQAALFGRAVNHDLETRRRVGYMSQASRSTPN